MNKLVSSFITFTGLLIFTGHVYAGDCYSSYNEGSSYSEISVESGSNEVYIGKSLAFKIKKDSKGYAIHGPARSLEFGEGPNTYRLWIGKDSKALAQTAVEIESNGQQIAFSANTNSECLSDSASLPDAVMILNGFNGHAPTLFCLVHKVECNQ